MSAGTMEEILDAYRMATGDLLLAVSGSDDVAIDAAIARRASLIDAYRKAVSEWSALLSSSRDQGVSERLQCHHAKIAEADDEVVNAIRSLQSDISDRLRHVELSRKAGRAYGGGGGVSVPGAVVDGDG